MTAVVISQPMYFPWPGFFELVSCADIFVHLDDAQFSKGSFTNRVQVKQPEGHTWMTIPLAEKGTFKAISELAPADESFPSRHRDLLSQSLRDAPHLPAALGLFDTVTQIRPLVDMLIASVELTARNVLQKVPQQWSRSGDMNVPGKSSERVLGIVKHLGGTRYITAHGAAQYLDHELFEAAGVEVEYVEYSKSPYNQLHGAFTPYVSILDLIANVGASASEYLRPRTTPWRSFMSRQSSQTAP